VVCALHGMQEFDFLRLHLQKTLLVLNQWRYLIPIEDEVFEDWPSLMCILTLLVNTAEDSFKFRTNYSVAGLGSSTPVLKLDRNGLFDQGNFVS